MIVVITLLAAIAGFIHGNEIRSVYTASSSLMVGVPEARVVDIEQVLSRRFYGNEAEGEIELLRSRRLAEQVVNRLNLLSHAEFNPSLRVPEKRFFDFLRYLDPRNWVPAGLKQSIRESVRGEVEQIELSEEQLDRRVLDLAINILLGKVSAERIEYTNVIVITARSPSPAMAARIANEIPEAYIEDQLQAKFDATSKATDWLMERMGELETKVAESERAVEIFREEHGFTQGATTVLLGEQISELNSQLIVARAERIELEARLDQIERLMAANGENAQVSVDLLSSPLLQQLRRQQGEALARAAELSVELGPKHPRMIQARAEIDDLSARISAEMREIAEGLRNGLEVARTREQSLETSLQEAEAAAGMQNREAIRLRALEREAASNRALFETFLNRFKETSSTQGLETSDSRIISAAQVPTSPSYPNRKRILIQFVLVGFLVGCALVLALNKLNPGLLSPEEVERALGVHVIGLLPSLASNDLPVRHLNENRSSAFIEALNSLQISMQLSDPDSETRVIMVTSSVPEEGKSTLSLALAMTLNRADRRVLLVDADLRRTGVEKLVGLPEDSPGLTDLVIDPDGSPDDYIVRLEGLGLDFLRSGDARHASAGDIFSSRRMQDIMSRLRSVYDYVLLDTPPIMAVADARVISRLADKTLFVVRWNKTPRKVAGAALDLLRKSNIDIAGAVLQQVDLRRYGRLGQGGSGYYYHYGRYAQYYRD